MSGNTPEIRKVPFFNIFGWLHFKKVCDKHGIFWIFCQPFSRIPHCFYLFLVHCARQRLQVFILTPIPPPTSRPSTHQRSSPMLRASCCCGRQPKSSTGPSTMAPLLWCGEEAASYAGRFAYFLFPAALSNVMSTDIFHNDVTSCGWPVQEHLERVPCVNGKRCCINLQQWLGCLPKNKIKHCLFWGLWLIHTFIRFIDSRLFLLIKTVLYVIYRQITKKGILVQYCLINILKEIWNVWKKNKLREVNVQLVARLLSWIEAFFKITHLIKFIDQLIYNRQ